MLKREQLQNLVKCCCQMQSKHPVSASCLELKAGQSAGLARDVHGTLSFEADCQLHEAGFAWL